MHRIATTHRINWLNVGKVAVAVVAIGVVLLSAITAMAMSSWLVNLTPP